jgi:protein involved in ribonucleotide reduction
LHSFNQLETHQTVPAVPTGSNDQEGSVGQQVKRFCTTDYNTQKLKASLASN